MINKNVSVKRLQWMLNYGLNSDLKVIISYLNFSKNKRIEKNAYLYKNKNFIIED